MTRSLSLVAAVALTVACVGKPSPDDPGGDAPDAGVNPGDPDAGTPETELPSDECGDLRPEMNVYYGTPEPTYLPMTEGQVLAVGSFNGCSGLLIAPTWVLTAKHCGVSSGSRFCIDYQAQDPSVCIRGTNVYNASGDMTLLELEQDARELLPGVIPVPILTEDLGSDWLGRTAEAAGFGQQENGGFNEREFTAEPIVSISGNTLTIDGQGQRGVCFGDSGGPVMVIATDGTVRVAGALSNGDTNCLGRDNYTRVDVFREWIESHTGPTIVDGGLCGAVTGMGRCMSGGMAMWCADDELQTESCDGDSVCGWDAASLGFRCIGGEDSCNGVDNYGACEDGKAKWCDNGVARVRDCGECGQTCEASAATGGVGCVDDPCMGTDYFGRCNADTVEWCDNGEYKTKDCAAEGKTCGWYSDEWGYYCLNN